MLFSAKESDIKVTPQPQANECNTMALTKSMSMTMLSEPSCGVSPESDTERTVGLL